MLSRTALFSVPAARPARILKLDPEDIEFDIYQRVRDLMHLSGLRMLPEQELPESNVHLWQLVLQASTASNGAAIREFTCMPHASHVQMQGWIAHC